MQNVRVDTVSFNGHKFVNSEDAHKYTLELLSLALDEHPDIIYLPECVNTIGAGALAQQLAKPLDERTIAQVLK